MSSDVRFGDLPVAEFVERLASATPVPGGGSAAAIAGSLAAGLVTMVATLSGDRPAYAQHAALHAAAITGGRTAAARLLALADEDSSAYDRFARALKLPRDTDPERETRATAMHAAARGAAEVPLRTVEFCLAVAAMAEQLAGRSNRNASSDLLVAALLALAAAEAAAANVRTNLSGIGDEAAAVAMAERTGQLMDEVRRLAEQTRSVVEAGAVRAPVDQ